MRRVFADTSYRVALAQPRDQLHARAMQASRTLQGAEVVTTEEISTEFLAYFSGRGRSAREAAIRHVEWLMRDPDLVVNPQTHRGFLTGFALYKARSDKGYSLTDCISMATMRREGITEVLTHDAHFTQEGFATLL